MKNEKKVPVLRFKDNDGKIFPPWEFVTLGDVGEIVSGLTYSPSDINESGVLVLRSSNVQERRLVFEDNVIVKTPKYNPVKEDDILICVRNGSKNLIGKNAIIKKENEGLAFGAFMTVFRSKFNRFLFQWFDTTIFKEKVATNLGATINSINGSDLKKFKISFPSLEEQQKIASFLTAMDNKINLLTEKKTLLEQYKKGVMQQIFSRRIQFKDEKGKVYPEWKDMKIEEVLLIKYGKDQKAIVKDNGKYPILGTGGVIGRTDKFLCDKPSVLIGRKGTIDRPLYLETPFWTVDTLFYTDVFDVAVPKWVYYQFQSINWYLYNEASGVPSLSASTIYKIKINLPAKKEQKRIADFLSSIDDKIKQVGKQLEHAQRFKKGLLHKMFV